MSRAPGVWITGPSRTGTSLTAGLFAAHGVFFGNTGDGDRFNARGYFEHPYLVSKVEGRCYRNWPSGWWAMLKMEGWNGSGIWGAKRGPQAWPWIKALQPSVIVVTRRPKDQIVASRDRWGRGAQTLRATRQAAELLERVIKTAPCPVVPVNTDLLVKGDYSRILPAFEALSIPFSEQIAGEWIDPGLWCQGGAA